MAITVVQTSSQASGGASSQSVTLSGVTNGNTLIVTVEGQTDSVGVPTAAAATDSQSNTYALDKFNTDGSTVSWAAILRASAVTGGSVTITVTFSGGGSPSQYMTVVAIEVSGLSSTIDTTSSGTATGSPATITSFSTTNAADLIVIGLSEGAQFNGKSITISTSPSGFTTFNTQLSAANAAGQFGYMITSTTQSGLAPSWTGSKFTDAAMVAVAYKAATAPTGKLFRAANLSGLGAGGPFFQNPLGDRPRDLIVCQRPLTVPRRKSILVPTVVG